MSNGLTARDKCRRASRNCELLTGLNEHHDQRCAEDGIIGPDARVNAAAVGLVIEVWRNGPVEEMHASRRGPSDAAMFAESTVLHREAVTALTVQHRGFGLIDLETLLLKRARAWAGTGGKTLKDLGHGHLGEYDRHVKDRINALIELDEHTCVVDPLEVYLVNRALMYGRRHKGMPSWPVIVNRIATLLRDPAHARWGHPDRGAQALASMPQQVSSIEALTAALVTDPASLPVDVLEWLSDHLLYCAGPPYTYGAGAAWDTSAH